jgi:DNA-binding transcriptional LysR family regulator
MELRQLRYFVALAEELHYGEAAQRLRISKPTLSQQIAVLERDLGAQLLDRTGRRVSLTRAGAVLLVEARQILVASDRCRASVAAAQGELATLDVRIGNGIAQALGPRLEARTSCFGLRINWAVTSSLDAEDAVVTGRADAAVTWPTSGRDSTLHETPIGSAEVSLAVPQGHRLASADVVDVEELVEEPIVLFHRAASPGVWDTFVAHLLPGGPREGRLLEEPGGLDPMRHILALVAAGQGVAPFVHAVAEAVAPPGVVLRPLDPPLHLPVQLVCRDPTRPELRLLMEALGRGSPRPSALKG